jgi:hypothetical protein
MGSDDFLCSLSQAYINNSQNDNERLGGGQAYDRTSD